jgi:ABC-type nitrate/sulfonate/bicarbonate transport system permease component
MATAVVAAIPRGAGQRPRRTAVTGGAVGLASLVVLWWALAVTVFKAGGAVPTPWAVVVQMKTDGWAYFGPNITATAWNALQGFVWGDLVAIAIALLVLLLPWLARPAMQLAIASYCLPIIAVGPILTIVFTGDAPIVALSALSVFFTTVVGTLLGLRAADPVSLDVITAYGGGRWAQLRKVQIVAALPGLLSALKIAAPAAFLGAIIGEWLGSTQTGLGIAMVTAEQYLEPARTWSVALVCGAIAGIGYAAVALVGRFVVPWVGGTQGGSGL